MLKFVLVVVITKGNNSFGIPHIFSLLQNPRTNLSSSLVETPHSFLFMIVNLVIYLFIVPLKGLLAIGRLRVMNVMYWGFHLWISSSSLLLLYFSPLAIATTLIVFLEDFFMQWITYFLVTLLGSYYNQSIVYSVSHPFLLNLFISSFNWMQSFVS